MRPLVDCRLRGEELERAFERIDRLPRIDLDRNQVLDLEKLANGTFTPLEGFLGKLDHDSVLARMRLLDGTPWSLPILLRVSRDAARGLVPRCEVLLWNAEEDRPGGLLDLEERFEIDPVLEAQGIFGTADRRHPGVAHSLAEGPVCLAGPIKLVAHSVRLIPRAYDLDPANVRAEIARRGWRTITGFQTRNLGHKAHEHLQKIGLELTDGLLIHPLIGWKKPGDMLPDVILDGYELLIDRYYPKERVILAGLTTAMRYAGPREALFHALIRRNFGCTHFIVGRDHAGVGGFYEKYAAHRVFDGFTPEELGILPLLLHGPCYCSICEEIVTEQICPHGGDAWVDISGTEIRAMIRRGERPPVTIMRPEMGDFLLRRSKSGGVFFEEETTAP